MQDIPYFTPKNATAFHSTPHAQWFRGRKLKKKKNINRSIKDDNEIIRETKTLVEKIKKLKHLYKNGSLTNIEFEQAKNKLLK